MKKDITPQDKELYQQINKRIGSISRGRKFIDYYKSFELARDIETIGQDIQRFVKDDVMKKM